VFCFDLRLLVVDALATSKLGLVFNQFVCGKGITKDRVGEDIPEFINGLSVDAALVHVF
jgi:hypothetical protein